MDMEQATKVKNFSHSPFVAERRRVLFPSEEAEDSDNDLGPMSPLSTDTEDEATTDKHYFESLSLKHASVDSEYVIIGNVKDDASVCPLKKCVESPIFLSPFHPLLTSPILISSDKCTSDDKSKIVSPSQKLKTPHDTSNCSTNMPKLIRKSISEQENSECHKRKDISPLCSPKSKREKLDNSKVRTALFPEQMFENHSVKNNVNIQECKNAKNKSKQLYLCYRGRGKNRLGQINAGVRHRIRKPKRKKLTKAQLLKTATDILDNSCLNEFLQEYTVQKPPVVNKIEEIRQIKPLPLTTAKELDNEPRVSQKRPHSPTNENRKFFKSSHTRGVVTLNKNIKLKVDGDKMTLMQKNVNRIHFDTSDLDVVNANKSLVEDDSISRVLEILSEEKENIGQTLTLRANVSVKASENSIHLHKGAEILSPISQMCDTTSGLALNSPKRVRNLSKILENMPSNSNETNIFNKTSCSLDMDQEKLFPVFNMTNSGVRKKEKNVGKSVNSTKKWKSLPSDQMLLDAGQKRFGVTQCHECELVYTMGDPNEELMHIKYHNGENVLRFNGWKNEKVLATFPNARIIHVGPRDSKVWLKKVKDLLDVVNRDLGFYETKINTENSQIFLYIKGKCIVGCVVAEPKEEGHRRLSIDGLDMCSTETFPIKCGISRIWVSPNHRKEGIATSLMDCLRANLIFGHILSKEEIAFSSPTDLGNSFAVKYFKTENYLIYM